MLAISLSLPTLLPKLFSSLPLQLPNSLLICLSIHLFISVLPQIWLIIERALGCKILEGRIQALSQPKPLAAPSTLLSAEQ